MLYPEIDLGIDTGIRHLQALKLHRKIDAGIGVEDKLYTGHYIQVIPFT